MSEPPPTITYNPDINASLYHRPRPEPVVEEELSIDHSDINDIRSQADFKGISFSGHKKPDVRKQLIENMLKGKLEPACYWASELICAGHYMEVWETILHYSGKHIHLGNPKLIIYLDMRFTVFRNIISQGHYSSELQLRNHNPIRKLFAEIISVLTLSNKNHSFEAIKINRVEEFDITQMTDRLKAPHIRFIEPIFLPKDPKELFIAANEFAYNISPERLNTITACYWIEWTIDFDAICKKRKEPCFCEPRTKYQVENKFRRDIIWIIWDTLIHYSNNMNNPFINKLMNALVSIFCIKYTTASCKKRRYLLYFAVALITEQVKTDIEIITNKSIVQSVIDNINKIYKQIKKNEQSPNTDYLFANLDKQNNFEQSMKKIEMMNSMNFGNG